MDTKYPAAAGHTALSNPDQRLFFAAAVTVLFMPGSNFFEADKVRAQGLLLAVVFPG